MKEFIKIICVILTITSITEVSANDNLHEPLQRKVTVHPCSLVGIVHKTLVAVLTFTVWTSSEAFITKSSTPGVFGTQTPSISINFSRHPNYNSLSAKGFGREDTNKKDQILRSFDKNFDILIQKYQIDRYCHQTKDRLKYISRLSSDSLEKFIKDQNTDELESIFSSIKCEIQIPLHLHLAVLSENERNDRNKIISCFWPPYAVRFFDLSPIVRNEISDTLSILPLEVLKQSDYVNIARDLSEVTIKETLPITKLLLLYYANEKNKEKTQLRKK